MENRPPYEVLGLTGEDVDSFVEQEPVPFELPKARVVFSRGQLDTSKSTENSLLTSI